MRIRCIVAASVVTAVVIHKRRITAFITGRRECRLRRARVYPMAFRLGIAAAGFIVAGLIIAIGGYAHRRRG